MLLAMPPLADGGGIILGIGLTVLLVFIVIALAQLILFIAGLVSLLGSDKYSGIGKLLWVVVMFFFPIIGPLVWFFVGRNVRQGI